MTTLSEEHSDLSVLRFSWKWYDVLAILAIILAWLILYTGADMLVTNQLLSDGSSVREGVIWFRIILRSSYAFYAGIAVTIGLYGRLRYRYSLQMLGFRRPTESWVWYTIILTVLIALAFIAVLIFIGIVGLVFELGFMDSDNTGSGTVLDRGMEFGNMAIISLAVIIVIFAPIAEEVLFRGVIHNVFRQRFGFWVATLLSSTVFGLAHIHPMMILNAFMIGITLAWLYEKYDSLWPPILMHMLRNGMVVVPILIAFLA